MGSGRTPFVPFGPDHLVAMSLIAMVAGGLALWVRRGPERRGRAAAWMVTGITAAAVAVFVARSLGAGTLSLRVLLPLHLCDLLLILGIAALFTRRPFLAEVVYYWAAAGTLMAVLTPDVRYGFPHARFVVFFGFHGLVIAMMAVLVLGMRVAPRSGSALRTWLFTNAYAAAVFLVNRAWGTNYMFLSQKPRGSTLLDLLGPWPWYILAASGVALALFLLLELPWRLRPSRRAPPWPCS